jgi:hypothetical protein
VDLDGTLAEYTEWQGPAHIGAPVEDMVTRVKEWLREGKLVKIFTARASHDNSYESRSNALVSEAAIRTWCKEHIGVVLPITCVKDYAMVELWDDRAVQVVMNTGQPVGFSTRGNGF